MMYLKYQNQCLIWRSAAWHRALGIRCDYSAEKGGDSLPPIVGCSLGHGRILMQTWLLPETRLLPLQGGPGCSQRAWEMRCYPAMETVIISWGWQDKALSRASLPVCTYGSQKRVAVEFSERFLPQKGFGYYLQKRTLPKQTVRQGLKVPGNTMLVIHQVGPSFRKG